MRTVFVNPSASMQNPRRKRRRRKNISMPSISNPRRKRGRKKRSVKVSKGYPVMVRSNAGIVPFVSNPLIMDNPRRSRGRRRRKNPLMGLSTLSVNKFVSKTLTYGGGAAIGAGVNILGLRRIKNDWLRNGIRVGVAVIGAAVMPGELGAAYAGSTLYPLFAEVALLTKLVQPATTPEADLSEISDALDELDEMYVADDDDELF
jgi:hypothetical protein